MFGTWGLTDHRALSLLQPVTWAQSPAGGALSTWAPELHTHTLTHTTHTHAEFEKCSGLPGYGTMDVPCSASSRETPAAMWPRRRTRRADRQGEGSGWSVASCRCSSVTYQGGKRLRVSADTVSLPPRCVNGALPKVTSNMAPRAFRTPLAPNGPRSVCVCEQKLRGVFIIVNFALICIHWGLRSQTHRCGANAAHQRRFRYLPTQ